uniref:Uncharacterized protein n=1 Tax=Cacopsylla melanoneura TaxID=428564 RepID=A0A8D8XBZ5_9HEMI
MYVVRVSGTKRIIAFTSRLIMKKKDSKTTRFAMSFIVILLLCELFASKIIILRNQTSISLYSSIINYTDSCPRVGRYTYLKQNKWPGHCRQKEKSSYDN